MFRTKKDAVAWARKIESDMDRALFVNQWRSDELAQGIGDDALPATATFRNVLV